MRRLEQPQKHWKFSSADVRERGFWADYMHAFAEAIRVTATPRAPWFVVPADNKWFTQLIVSAAIVEAVEKLDLSYPKIDAAKKKELVAARAACAREVNPMSEIKLPQDAAKPSGGARLPSAAPRIRGTIHYRASASRAATGLRAPRAGLFECFI
jgi:hypothetical protein